MDKKLYYDDIALVPKFSNATSRSELDVSTNLGDRSIKLPVIPANMKCVIDTKIAHFLSEHYYFYIMHRFDIDNYEFVKKCNKYNWNLISISVGVKESDKIALTNIAGSKLRVDFITIDIAHGHSILMRDMIKFIRDLFPTVKIIAGNICTKHGYYDLVLWGADIIKVGVGPGAACTTKLKTGFTYPMFSCVSEIDTYRTENDLHIPIIADGGIEHNGDIAKALVAGADYVMCGKLFSECIDSPAPLINGQKHYFGSASEHNKGHSKNIEGKLLQLNQNGMTFEDKLQEIKQDLQSALSYSGCKDLSQMWVVEWILI